MSEVVIDNLTRKLEERGASDIKMNEVDDNKNSLNRLGKIYLASLMQNGSRKRIIYGEDGKKIATFSDGKVEFNRADLSDEEKKGLFNLVEERFGLANLGKIANLSGKPRFQLKGGQDGSTLFDKLQIRDSEMAQKLPDGLTTDSLYEEFLTFIDSNELPQGAIIKNINAPIIPVIATRDGKVFEIPPSVLEFQGTDSQSLKFEREKNTLKEDENGKVVQFPENIARATEKARFKIVDKNNRNRDDEQYLSFKISTDYLHGTSDSKGSHYNTEVYYERVRKNESNYDLQKGTHGDTIFAEEIPPYDRVGEVSDKANEHREDLISDDSAQGEILEANIEKTDQIISSAIKNWGLDKIPERDANEVNRIMRNEIVESTKKINKEKQTSDAINSEITSTANEKAKYLDMAYKIAKDSNIYGIRDVYDEIMEIKSKNKEIDDMDLYKQVKEQIYGQRVLGDNFGGVA